MINYATVVDWDSTLADVGFADADNPDLAGLAVSGLKITTGAPAATAGVWLPGAIVQNIVSGVVYQNIGTTASPSWAAMENSAAGLTLPYAGTFSGTTTVGFQQTATSLTTGSAFKGIAGVALTTGGIYEADLGLAVTGFAFKGTVTGVYTGAGLLQLTAASATTGTIAALSAAGLTTGIIYKATAAAATLTTGRYYSANDGALEVWGIGANGHIHTAQTTAPTIAVTTPNGITAAAITAGASDTCGIITTTGTNNAGGNTVLDVTFNKTYTTAPKAVVLTPRNASAAKAAATSLALPYISAVSATGFTITIPSDASAGATPSFGFLVIA